MFQQPQRPKKSLHFELRARVDPCFSPGSEGEVGVLAVLGFRVQGIRALGSEFRVRVKFTVKTRSFGFDTAGLLQNLTSFTRLCRYAVARVVPKP